MVRAHTIAWVCLALAACGGKTSGEDAGALGTTAHPDATRSDSAPGGGAHDATAHDAGLPDADAGPSFPDASIADAAIADAAIVDADAAVSCTVGTITFNMTADTSGFVYYGGSQPPWPAQDSCPSWLTIYRGGTFSNLILSSGDCNHSCLFLGTQDAGTLTTTWDGTYYPVDTENPFDCQTPACAPVGAYTAVFCVAAALQDASVLSGPQAPPTCVNVDFTWPPAGGSQTISETIVPTLDGG